MARGNRGAVAEASVDVVATLNELILAAVRSRASDIHIEPKADNVRIRYRIDGVMVPQKPLSLSIAAPLISRVKILGRMDIAEKRQPQDGNFKLDVGPRHTVSLRASTFPAFDGEKCVLRVLESAGLMDFESLGMSKGQVKVTRRLTHRTGGLLLVTGPTGAGKTSTLYAMLSELDTTRLNIVTLEDPIEVQISDITQGQVNNRAGFTFAGGLRSILRQDPDVILVGEMRDRETAEIAIQASLTGHLVLSTLHTSSTIETITRLVDIGLEPYTVANALVGVIAQRLVRIPCQACSKTYRLDTDVTAEVGFPMPEGSKLVQAVGCKRCLNTGYRGRTGIFEIVEVDDRLRSLIKGQEEATRFKRLLREMGIPTLRRAGMNAALRGKTTPSEVLRVT
jgi:general secretion pathway protein E/type IV pilus assembly protein PilB